MAKENPSPRRHYRRTFQSQKSEIIRVTINSFIYQRKVTKYGINCSFLCTRNNYEKSKSFNRNYK